MMKKYMHISPSLYLFVHPYILLSVCTSISLSLYLSIFLSLYLSISLSLYLSISLSLYLVCEEGERGRWEGKVQFPSHLPQSHFSDPLPLFPHCVGQLDAIHIFVFQVANRFWRRLISISMRVFFV